LRLSKEAGAQGAGGLVSHWQGKETLVPNVGNKAGRGYPLSRHQRDWASFTRMTTR
jgi:hypothetical protein